MKNVLQLLGYAAPYRGNFIPSLEVLEKRYNQGHFVYVFPANAEHLAWMDAFRNTHTVYFMPLSFFGKRIGWHDLKTFRQILRKECVEVIHCHFLTYSYPLFAARKTVARHCKFICHVHNQLLIPATKSAPLKKYVMEHLYDLIVGVSEATAEGVRKAIRHNAVIGIPNAICFSRLDEYEPVSLRDYDSQQVVLMAGWPAEVKGIDIAVKAIDALRSVGRDVVLRIMLSGDFERTERFICNVMGYMPAWVRLLQPREDVAANYNAADVFLSASRTEGLSYAVIENAWCNALLCCSDLPGNSLDIPHMFSFPVGDTDACRNALQKALDASCSHQHDEIKECQRNYVRAQFNIDTWAESVIACYN